MKKHDFWANIKAEKPDTPDIKAYLKVFYRREIAEYRGNIALKRLKRWELSTDKEFVVRIRAQREENGLQFLNIMAEFAKVEKIAILGCSGQTNNYSEFGSGNVKVSIEQGSEWLHTFPIFWFIKTKNAPQIAIWTEDMDGNFLSTIYVTKKLAKQSWTAAGGNRRKESLPCWSHAQGKQYADGLYLPTKNEPLPDAVTGATPKGSFTTNLQVSEDMKQFVVKCEFNHSTDFNEHYPKDAKEGDTNYSGGKMGSGQPAIVYQVVVDLTNGQHDFKGELIGHSSSDGSDGKIYPDTSKLTTAMDIVKGVAVYINQ